MGFRIPRAVLRGFQIPQAKISLIPESRLTYKRRIRTTREDIRGERKIGNVSTAYPKSRLSKSVALFVQSILLGIITVMIL